MTATATSKQAKDISDADFLAAIDTVCTIRRSHGFGASRWDIAAVLAGDAARVAETARLLDAGSPHGAGIVDYPDFPDKLILAKARKLVRRGVVEGCCCGCRGDFNPA
jgi:hypothetical protein